MKVKLIKLEKSFWCRDKWVECDEIFDIDDNCIPHKGDFFILENTNTFYKCLGRAIYGNVGMKLYVEDIKILINHTKIMNNMVREIVYEDDKVIAYADYDLAGRIYSDKEVDLYITHKKGIEYIDTTITLDKLNNE